MYTIWIMLAFLALYIVRAVIGPSIWDRFLAMNLVSTKALLIMLLYATYREMFYLMDLAIVYTLLWFISIVFIAPFLLERLKRGQDV